MTLYQVVFMIFFFGTSCIHDFILNEMISLLA